jgi:hypothetical protein
LLWRGVAGEERILGEGRALSGNEQAFGSYHGDHPVGKQLFALDAEQSFVLGWRR